MPIVDRNNTTREENKGPKTHESEVNEGVQQVIERDKSPMRQNDEEEIVPVPTEENMTIGEDQVSNQTPIEIKSESDDEEEEKNEESPRRSTRRRVANKKYHGNEWITFVFDEPQNLGLSHDETFLIESDLNTKTNDLTRQFDILHVLRVDDHDEDIIHGIHPLAFSARANAEDTPRYNEAMSSPDRDGFIEAMKVELNQLSDMNAFICVPRQKAIDEKKRIIDSTWAFKRKRYPDGRVKKLKARLCVRGDQQIEGADFFETYSPVVSWSTIRLLLILSIILDLKSKQVDYTLAFVHAEAEPGTYIEMPRMFEKPGFILELKRNLYGQRDAHLKFFNYLKAGLEDRGFSQARSDPCLFYTKDVLILTYVDDYIVLSLSEKKIDDVIKSMRKARKEHGSKAFLVNVEDDYAGLLGIDQTEIATSTMHSEYIALSTGMRELLPTSNTFNEICEALNIQRSDDCKVVRAYEDNEGALKLANAPLPRCTPQSKHFAVKYHWFREKISEYNIQMLPIRTDKQKADIFTKGLARSDFKGKRKLLMGW